MKKITTIIVLITFFGCKTSTKTSIQENSEQDNFLTFLKNSCATYETKANDIQKNDFLEEYLKTLLRKIDSIGIIQNWNGVIKDINLSNWDTYNAIQLKAEIEIKLSKYQELTFEINKIISNKNKDSLLIYQQLKSLTVGTPIYFSGVIAKDKDNNIDFGMSFSLDKSDRICDPEIKFHLAYITKDKDELKGSLNLDNALNIQNSIWKTMEERANNNLLEKDFKTKLQEYKVQLDKVFPELTEYEKNYVKALAQCFADEFMK